MKTILIITSLLLAAFIILFFILGVMSRTGKAPGLVDGSLARCPDKPNCVCSEQIDDTRHFIAPIVVPDNITLNILSVAREIILDMGGTIQAETDQYLAATFTSAVFGFVDDFEIRIDPTRNVIHIRSASRVGHSDMGVNRKRAERFRQLYIERILSSARPAEILEI